MEDNKVNIKSIRSTDEFENGSDIYEIGFNLNNIRGSIYFMFNFSKVSAGVSNVYYDSGWISPEKSLELGILNNKVLYADMTNLVIDFENFLEREDVEYFYHFLPQGADWRKYAHIVANKMNSGHYTA